MQILREGKYKYLNNKARENRNRILYSLLILIVLFLLSRIHDLFGYVMLIPFLAFFTFLRRYWNYKRGLEGEKKVVETLQSLDNSYYLINDIVLNSKHGNIDHIILSPNEIFVIETKNFRGQIGCYRDNWYYPKYEIPSISKQAKRNALLVKRITGVNFVQPLLVFTNSDVELKLNSPTIPVLKLQDLCDFIEKKNSRRFTDRELRRIGEIIISQCKEIENCKGLN